MYEYIVQVYECSNSSMDLAKDQSRDCFSFSRTSNLRAPFSRRHRPTPNHRTDPWLEENRLYKQIIISCGLDKTEGINRVALFNIRERERERERQEERERDFLTRAVAVLRARRRAACSALSSRAAFYCTRKYS